MSERLPTPLLEARLGPVELRSRIVLSPMTTGFGFAEGVPGRDVHRLLPGAQPRRRDGRRRVRRRRTRGPGRGEAALDVARGHRGAAAAARRRAARRGSARACLQLGHGGRQVSPVVTGLHPVAPSPVPPPVHVKEPPHELSARRGRGDRGRPSGRAAARAADAGFDAVELHAGHGYLVHQFLAAASNLRTDAYGGDPIVERARFGAEVVSRIRREAPGLALVVRLNGEDITPGGIEAGGRARGRAAASPQPAPTRSSSRPASTAPCPTRSRCSTIPRRPTSSSPSFLKARAVGAGAHGRRHRAAGRRRGGAPTGRLRRGRRRAGADRRSGLGREGGDGSHGRDPALHRARRRVRRDARPRRPDRVRGESRGRPGAPAAAAAVTPGARGRRRRRARRARGCLPRRRARARRRPPRAVGASGRRPPRRRADAPARAPARLVSWYERRLQASGAELRTGDARHGRDDREPRTRARRPRAGACSEPSVLDGYDALADVDDRGLRCRACPPRSATARRPRGRSCSEPGARRSPAPSPSPGRGRT